VTVFRYPNITGSTEGAQLRQLKSYLYQLVDQLNNSPLAGSQPIEPQIERKAPSERETAENFAAIKGLITKSNDIISAYAEQIDKKLSQNYAAQTDFGDFSRQTQKALRANSTAIDQCQTSINSLLADLELQELRTHIRTVTVSDTALTLPMEGTVLVVGDGIWGILTVSSDSAAWSGTEGVSCTLGEAGVTLTLPRAGSKLLLLSPEKIEI
jgi:hypothetical protein